MIKKLDGWLALQPDGIKFEDVMHYLNMREAGGNILFEISTNLKSLGWVKKHTVRGNVWVRGPNAKPSTVVNMPVAP